MAMKILYLKVDGSCKVENWKVNARNLEMPDGPHPVTNDSIWQDSKRTGPAVMMVIQDVFGPYGASMAAEDVKTRMYEVKLASMAFKQPSVSRMWQRMLANAFAFFMKYGIILFIVALVGYSVITTLTGA
jgi:hypothetical protein